MGKARIAIRRRSGQSRYEWIGCGMLLILGIVLLSTTRVQSAGNRFLQLQPMPQITAAPLFSLPSADGGQVDLATYRGQVVVINFWATWCAPCRREMPSLQRAWEELQKEGVMLLAIASQDDPDMVSRFLKRTEVTFPVLIDEDGRTSQQWPFSGIPATFVIDPEGNVVYRALGIREWDSQEILSQVVALGNSDGG